MRKISRGTGIVIGVALAVIIIGGYFVGTRLVASAVPDAFIDARMEGGRIAEEISALSGQTRDDLQRVQELERQGKRADALNLVAEIRMRNASLKEKALTLANQLETMTQSADDIRVLEARASAVESVEVRLSMIARIIAYNDSVTELLDLLEARLARKPIATKRVGELVASINEEVKAINDLNAEALAKAQEFDERIRAAQ